MKKSVVKENGMTVKLSFNLSAKMADILALSTNACMNGNCNKKAHNRKIISWYYFIAKIRKRVAYPRRS